MSISLNANFELLSAGLYLDARQQFNTIIEMKDFAETSIPDGFITYNKETQKHYVFNSSNTVDATLGKWREYNSGGGSSADLILDTEVRIDKTYSSSKIYTDIQQCLEDSKTYTLEEIDRASTASYKVVTDVIDMTEERYLYLLYDGTTNYDIYIVETDGTPTKIGNTQIDLSNYYTKTKIDNDFLKKVDADGKYATITTVDGKVDKDKIVTVLDDTVTDEQVASALLTKTELDKTNAKLVDKADKEELEDYMNIRYNFLEQSTDLNTLMVAGRYMSRWGDSNSLVNKPSGFSSEYEVIVTVTPLKRIGNYGEYIEQTFVSRSPKSSVYTRIIENKAPTQPAWTELVTMDNLDELFQSVSNGKTLVANAITDKGVSTSTTATFATMATNIRNLNSMGYTSERKSGSKTVSRGSTASISITFSNTVIGVTELDYDLSNTHLSYKGFSISGNTVTVKLKIGSTYGDSTISINCTVSANIRT